MSRYQGKPGMNHSVALQNDTSQSPHQSGHEKKHPNSLIPSSTKPYRHMDYSKGTPEHDLHQMPFPMPPIPDLNNSVLENETPVMQTDLEKYAEMQSFCMNRRARSTFTAYQLQRLEGAFKCAHYVDATTRSKLAEELNLSDSIILVGTRKDIPSCCLLFNLYCLETVVLIDGSFVISSCGACMLVRCRYRLLICLLTYSTIGPSLYFAIPSSLHFISFSGWFPTPPLS